MILIGGMKEDGNRRQEQSKRFTGVHNIVGVKHFFEVLQNVEAVFVQILHIAAEL